MAKPIAKVIKPEGCTGCSLYSVTARCLPQAPPGGKIDILILGNFPMFADVQGPFQSKAGLVVKGLVDSYNAKLDTSKKARIGYCYSTQCVPMIQKWKITSENQNLCKPNLLRTIDMWKPKVIVALGKEAFKSLGFTDTSLKAARGNFYEKNFGSGVVSTVIPTFHPAAIQASPGYANLLRIDIRKAFLLAKFKLEEYVKEVRTPRTYEAIIKELDLFKAAIDANWEKTGKPLVTAVDSETTSVKPYNPHDRVIAISLSYQAGIGLAFTWEHRSDPRGTLEQQHISEYVEELLGSEKVALVEHNGKFDQQWFKYHYKLNFNEIFWDTLLCEHLIDEDKKGEYDLKGLAQDYFPGTGRYEEALKKLMAELTAKRALEHKELWDTYKAELRTRYASYWVALSHDQRLHKLSDWQNAGHIGIADATLLLGAVIKKGTNLPTKKWTASAFKMFQRIPPECMEEATEGLVAPPEEPEVVTFEDVPVEMMLYYAAIDAIMTRLLVSEQWKKFAEDDKKIEAVGRMRGEVLQTKPIYWALQNLTLPTLRTLTHMEYHGVKVNRELITEYMSILDEKILIVEDVLRTRTGMSDFNPNTDQLGHYLYEILKLPILSKSEKTGAPSTDADTIKLLCDDYEEKHPELRSVLQYRKLGKVRNTYLKNWLAMSELDGRIHAKFNQNGTGTYRLSSSSPNLRGNFGGCKTV